MTTTNEQSAQQSGKGTGSGKGKSRRDRYSRIAIDPDDPGTPAPTSGTEQPAATGQPAATAPPAAVKTGSSTTGADREKSGRTPASTPQDPVTANTTAPEKTPRGPEQRGDEAGQQADTDKGEAAERAAPTDSQHAGEDPNTWRSTLDDPALVPGESDYRSFYIDDEWFGRWRAAIYWNARNPQARGTVPRNMSEGLNERLKQEALAWEAQFNGGEVYPPTDDQVKAHRRRQASGHTQKKRDRKDSPHNVT